MGLCLGWVNILPMLDNPRLILVCCEGLTEELYFRSLVASRRINAVIMHIASYKGSQHESLIGICEAERNRVCAEEDLTADELEVWAVFDKDDWKGGFTALEQYAADKGVLLAYSDPQFETYLLQHMEQSSCSDSGATLEAYLSSVLVDAGYGEYDKSNLSWLIELMDAKPKIIETAILNADIRSRRTKTPFLTVQKLTKRLLEFELR